jgi:site-specific recombinase XerD
LTSGTADYYCASAKAFLFYRFGSEPLELERVNAKDVVDFIRTRARKTKPRTLRLTITGLRALLRYCLFRGDIKAQLIDVVPAVASWFIRPELPRAISAEHARSVIDSCDTNTVVGLRDRAILLLLARLGLRGAEIRALQLEDVDWDAGHLRIQGKNGRETLMPLPVDVGEAIAAYLAQGRPQRPDRHLFLRVHAPVTGLGSADAVGYIVSNALERAGIDTPHKGAHQFRHALAVHMLRQGATLPEIGEVLRHRSLTSTSIYARIDIAALRDLAMPWPGSQS